MMVGYVWSLGLFYALSTSGVTIHLTVFKQEIVIKIKLLLYLLMINNIHVNSRQIPFFSFLKSLGSLCATGVPLNNTPAENLI